MLAAEGAAAAGAAALEASLIRLPGPPAGLAGGGGGGAPFLGGGFGALLEAAAVGDKAYRLPSLPPNQEALSHSCGLQPKQDCQTAAPNITGFKVHP